VSQPAREPLPRGERLIMLYKFAKAASQVAAAVVIIVALQFDLTIKLVHVVAMIANHLTSQMALRAARFVLAHLSSGTIGFTAAALAADAVISVVEGWALYHRHWWGPWLVVLATGSLIPLEVYELVRKVRLGRAIILVLNVAVVVYLVIRLRARRQHHR
jgi:uncharacterized membrane protein (DUF2068 family)